MDVKPETKFFETIIFVSATGHIVHYDDETGYRLLPYQPSTSGMAYKAAVPIPTSLDHHLLVLKAAELSKHVATPVRPKVCSW